MHSIKWRAPLRIYINKYELFRICYADVPDKSNKKILSIISRLKEAGPLSAEGFYDVNKSLLVALTGTLLTYVIILVQM